MSTQLLDLVSAQGDVLFRAIRDCPTPFAIATPTGRLLLLNHAFNERMRTSGTTGGEVGKKFCESTGGAAVIDHAIFERSGPRTWAPEESGGAGSVFSEPLVDASEQVRSWVLWWAAPDELGNRPDSVISALQALLGGIESEGSFVVATDLEGRVLMLSRAGEAALGHVGRGAAGKPIDALFRRSSGLVEQLVLAADQVSMIRGQWAEIGGRGRRTALQGVTGRVIRDETGRPRYAMWLVRELVVAHRLAETAASARSVADQFVIDFFPEPARIRSLRKGESIVRRGDPVQEIYILLDGQVRSYLGPENRPRVIDYAFTGLLGVWDACDSSPTHSYSVDVTKNARICVIGPEELSQHPEKSVHQRFSALVQDQHMRLVRRVDMLLQPSHRKRLARLLENYARGARCDDAGLLLPRVSQVELAEQIGATRKTVSDCLREFARERIVRLGERTIWVRDLEALQRI